MSIIIRVENLSKVFETKVKKETKKFTAVDNVSFEVEQGEIVGFIGPNGAGKSTTIKMMTGILFPTDGTATVATYNPWTERKQMAYKIATMFGQKSSLLSHLPVIDSYRLLGAIYDIPKDTIEERIKEIVSFFGIENLLDQKVSSLSLGQRMICEVASVTLHRPDVIFFDEPTIGLDIVVKKKVRDMIRMLNKNYGTTIFITSHDISDIEKLCSRIVLINHGKVMLDSNIEDIRTKFLSKKKLTVTFEEAVSKEKIATALDKYDVDFNLEENVAIIEFDENKTKVGTIISKLLEICGILDMAINTTSLENVIYDIYIESYAKES